MIICSYDAPYENRLAVNRSCSARVLVVQLTSINPDLRLIRIKLGVHTNGF